jgi:hypothetical protein
MVAKHGWSICQTCEKKDAGKRDAAGIAGGNASRYIMAYSIAHQCSSLILRSGMFIKNLLQTGDTYSKSSASDCFLQSYLEDSLETCRRITNRR